jgi:hypothetical protein
VKAYEKLNYNKYSKINEKVGNGSGTNIGFILGDELSTDGVDKFLKDQGINKVEDINFTQLASIFTDKMRELATNEVSKENIVKIQQGVSTIIYHETPTPKGKAMTPGTGGGVSEQPTSLMVPWQKKVEATKGQFKNFLNTDSIDPFKVSVSNYSSEQLKGIKDGEKSKLAELVLLTELFTPKGITAGFKKKKPITPNGTNMIRLSHKNIFYGPVVALEDGGAKKVFKYLGSINLQTVVADLKASDIDGSNIPKYVSVFSQPPRTTPNSGDIPAFLIPLFNNQKTEPNETRNLLEGVYFVFENAISSQSDGTARTNKAQIFFLYVRSGGITTGGDVGAVFSIYSVNQDCVGITKIVDLTKLHDAKFIDFKIGESFELDAACKLKPIFDAPKNKITTKFLSIPGVTY